MVMLVGGGVGGARLWCVKCIYIYMYMYPFSSAPFSLSVDLFVHKILKQCKLSFVGDYCCRREGPTRTPHKDTDIVDCGALSSSGGLVRAPCSSRMTAFNMGHRGNGRERNFSAKEERKLRKPLIEKKRRERINCSLEQLKGIMVDAYNLDQSKLEKADVLEVTVQHMEGLQKGHGSGSPSGPSMGFESQQRYSSGYIQCMHEVHNLLKSCPGMDKTLGARLLIHLLKSLPHISSETGAGNTGGNGTNGINGTPTRAIGMSNSNSGCIGGGSPMSGSGPVSPPQSPLSLSSGGGAQSFQPCCLQIPYAKLPLQPSPPPIGSSPLHTLCSQVHSGRDGRDQQKSISSSPPCYPNLPQPGVFHPAPLSPFFPPGGDPSMWRPW